MNMNECPFKVGDRVRSKPTNTYWIDDDGVAHTQQFPSAWPEATITAIREDGFDYKYDQPYFMGSRIGVAEGGTCFPIGYSSYERVDL